MALGSVTFQRYTVRSALPAARVLPSGLNATDMTGWAASFSGLPRRAGRLVSAPFHRWTELSVDPAARIRLSGLNARATTERPVFRVRPRSGRAGSVLSHRLIVPASSSHAAARVSPVGLKATIPAKASGQ